MEHVELGRTGRRVSRIGLGALPLSFEGRPGRSAARQVVWRALDLGVTLFDTADSYCLHAGEMGHNERLLREALDAHPDGAGAVVATKGGIARQGARMELNGHPAYLRRACERSLKALAVECIDLYQLHSPDPAIPFAESVGALAGLLAEGKVRAVGISNVTVSQVREAMEIVPLTSVQNHYNPWDRGAETSGLLELCAAEGITFLPHSPVGGARRVGLLRGSPALAAIAREHAASPVELVLAWLLARNPTLAAIPGASRVASVESSVRAAELRLDDATLTALETAFASLPEGGWSNAA
ncbi:MAG TPA: aldo/keto reductase [Longimicrobiaceae bacterium]|nr:aldo/keto reductase [Longimicrobiaceae bacterium]